MKKIIRLHFIFIVTLLSMCVPVWALPSKFIPDTFSKAGIKVTVLDITNKVLYTDSYPYVLTSTVGNNKLDVNAQKVFIICDGPFQLSDITCDDLSIKTKNPIYYDNLMFASTRILNTDYYIIPLSYFYDLANREILVTYLNSMEHSSSSVVTISSLRSTDMKLLIFLFLFLIGVICIFILIKASRFIYIRYLHQFRLRCGWFTKVAVPVDSFVVFLTFTLGMFSTLPSNKNNIGIYIFVLNYIFLIFMLSAKRIPLKVSMYSIFIGFIFGLVLNIYSLKFSPSASYQDLIPPYKQLLLPIKLQAITNYRDLYVLPKYNIFVDDIMVYSPSSNPIRNIPVRNLNGAVDSGIYILPRDSQIYINSLLAQPELTKVFETDNVSKFFFQSPDALPKDTSILITFSCSRKLDPSPISLILHSLNKTSFVQKVYFPGCSDVAETYNIRFYLNYPDIKDPFIAEIADFNNYPIASVKLNNVSVHYLMDNSLVKTTRFGNISNSTTLTVYNFMDKTTNYTIPDSKLLNLGQTINDGVNSKLFSKDILIWSDSPGVVISTRFDK